MNWTEYVVPTLIVLLYLNGNKSSRVRPYGEGGGRRSEGDRESSSTEQAVSLRDARLPTVVSTLRSGERIHDALSAGEIISAD